MGLSRSVAEILREHVALEIEGIDRIYLNVYFPQLQREGGVASFFRFHRGYPFASSVLMDPISKAFYVQDNHAESFLPVKFTVSTAPAGSLVRTSLLHTQT